MYQNPIKIHLNPVKMYQNPIKIQFISLNPIKHIKIPLNHSQIIPGNPKVEAVEAVDEGLGVGKTMDKNHGRIHSTWFTNRISLLHILISIIFNGNSNL